jgi:hypothetical protein
MGCSSSRENHNMIMDEDELHERALHNFNIRIANYSYAHHGPYHKYVQWCRAEYELECIPEYCRYGSAYRI